MRAAGLAAGLTLVATAGWLGAENREAAKKKRALEDTEVATAWVYDDLKAALGIARKQDKPIFLVFR